MLGVLLESIKYAIAQKEMITRKNATEGGVSTFNWVVNYNHGIFNDRIEAMRSYFGKEAKNWSDDMVKRQFRAIQYNWKHAKVVRI